MYLGLEVPLLSKYDNVGENYLRVRTQRLLELVCG
jgi:hypothetical protein